MNDAIAAHKLPGALVVIGHGGKIVFHQAYGLRKLAGEPGLDGLPAPAEPMTENTIFDMASLTKCLATWLGYRHELFQIARHDLPRPRAATRTVRVSYAVHITGDHTLL